MPFQIPSSSRALRWTVLAVSCLAVPGAAAQTDLPRAEDPRAPRYRLIVNPANPVQALPRRTLSRLFLKRAAHWPHGRAAEPVDLAETFAAREAFSRHVHQRPVGSIKAYWQRMLFSGQAAPPPELPSEDDVIALVRTHPDAVGYVSDEASLRGVKILDVIEDPPES